MAIHASPGSVPLREGAAILDCTGKELGTLSGSRESYFKVKTSWAPDYWLPRHLIASADSNSICLSIAEDELEGRKVEAMVDDMTAADLEEAKDSHTLHPAGLERRYEAEAEYQTYPNKQF
jgi:hypothetical protein